MLGESKEIMAKRQFGNIRHLPSGRWQATYLHNGVREKAPTTFATKKDADLFLAGVQKDISDGTWKRKNEGNQPFAPFALQWLESKKGEQIRRTTFEDYERLIKLHINPKWGSYSLNSIKHIEVQNWINTISGGSARRVKSTMNQVMVEAIRNGILESNPCEYLKVRRTTRYEPNILTPEQLNALFEEIPPCYRLFTATLGLMGLRFGEACALRPKRVINDSLEIAESVTKVRGGYDWTPTKTYETGLVSMPPSYKEELISHIHERGLKDDDLLFTTEQGNLIDNRNFHKRVWKPAIARLIEKGILVKQIVPKDLRATNASIVADAFGLVEAQRRMRHSSSNITGKHYARPLAGRDTQVANHLDGLMSKQPALALAN